MPKLSSITYKGIYSPRTNLINNIILSLTPSVTSINEGSSVTFTVTTRGVVDGTILYWDVDNISTSTVDFSTLSGSFTITGNSGSFTVTPTADLLLEGVEAFTVSIYSYYTGGVLLITSQNITINDTSFPTYSLTRSVASVNEGTSFTITFVTNMPGSFPYTITGITSADIGGASLTGTVTNGNVLTYTATADSVTEGAETFSIALDNGAASTTVLINDTSIYPISYSVSPDVSSLNEGSTVTFTVSTVSVPNGTTLYWTDSGTGTTNATFSSNSKSGSFVINSSSGTITRTVLNNYVTDTARSIIINIRTSSTAGTIVATSSTVTLTDGPSLSVAPNITSINEGDTVTYTITPSSYLAEGTTLYWSTSGTTVAADFSDSTVSGSFTISGGVGTVSRTVLNDLSYPAEGLETIIFNVRNLSTSGTIVATATTVSIADTSIGTPTVRSLRYLVIGGGGGGGNNLSNLLGGAGGGGAGGVRAGYTNFTALTTYTIVRGSGGSGGQDGTLSSVTGTSVSIIAAGGGRGGAGTTGFSGGSGGGGGKTSASANFLAGGAGNTPSTSPAQGFNGGTAGGGGDDGGGGGGSATEAGSGAPVGGGGGSGGSGYADTILTGMSGVNSRFVASGGGGGAKIIGLPKGGGGNSGGSNGSGGDGGGSGGPFTATANGGYAGTFGSGGGGASSSTSGSFLGGTGGTGTVSISIPNSITPTTTGSVFIDPDLVGNNVYTWGFGGGTIILPQ